MTFPHFFFSGSIPLTRSGTQWENNIVGIPCCITDARASKATLACNGFSLAQNESWLSSDVDSRMGDYYEHVAEIALKESGASFSVAYCHARRSTNDETRTKPSGAGFAAYAHTDQSSESWSALLPELIGEWESRGPPGLKRSFAERAAQSSRYSIVSAWKYLGPAPCCRSSHLAVLDHSSVERSDIIPFSIVGDGCYGGNYRLKQSESSQSRHRWFYYPRMTPSETLLFTVFDSNHPSKEELFKNTPVATVFHAAFEDSTAPENEPPRESIDVRILLVWD